MQDLLAIMVSGLVSVTPAQAQEYQHAAIPSQPAIESPAHRNGAVTSGMSKDRMLMPIKDKDRASVRGARTASKR